MSRRLDDVLDRLEHNKVGDLNGPQSGAMTRAPKRRTALERIGREILAGEYEGAKEAGALGYMAKILVQVSLPHSNPRRAHFERRNGAFVLSVVNRPRVGLPYGRYPRLLLAWTTTEAVQKKSRELHLGHSLTSFLAKLGLHNTGGQYGTIGRLRAQMIRLYSSTISFRWESESPSVHELLDQGFRVTDSVNLWWNPKDPDQLSLWGSTIQLSEPFYRSVIERPVPVDLRALRALRSPMALDLYAWLGWRLSYLRKPVEIPWEALQAQFGADYKRTRAFKAKLLKALGQVLTFYPDARISEGDIGLVLRPAPTHIPKLGD